MGEFDWMIMSCLYELRDKLLIHKKRLEQALKETQEKIKNTDIVICLLIEQESKDKRKLNRIKKASH